MLRDLLFYCLTNNFYTIMKKIVLSNGLRVVKTNNSSVYSLSVTVAIGHLNEPKLGLAAVCEKVLSKQFNNAVAIQGGTITSYLTGSSAQEFETLLQTVSSVLKNPNLSQRLVDAAAEDVAQHTRDLAPLPERQWKLRYKHTAFGSSDLVWDAEAYIASVKSLKTEDLEAVVDTYYTAANIVIGVACDFPLCTLRELMEKYFGTLPKGKKQHFEKLEYTGGYAQLPVVGGYKTIAIGWDVSDLSGVSEANVMMSMFSGRLERDLANTCAVREVKIAGYYGLRTLRASIVVGADEDINPYIDILCNNIKRLCTTEASKRRMETSRQRAATEKLAKFSQPQDAAVEVSWQELGRKGMYDVDERINATFLVSARDVKDIAIDIFRTKPTIVVAAENPYSKEEILEKLRW